MLNDQQRDNVESGDRRGLAIYQQRLAFKRVMGFQNKAGFRKPAAAKTYRHRRFGKNYQTPATEYHSFFRGLRIAGVSNNPFYVRKKNGDIVEDNCQRMGKYRFQRTSAQSPDPLLRVGEKADKDEKSYRIPAVFS